jgi:hypothetical protein
MTTEENKPEKIESKALNEVQYVNKNVLHIKEAMEAQAAPEALFKMNTGESISKQVNPDIIKASEVRTIPQELITAQTPRPNTETPQSNTGSGTDKK